MKRTIVTPAVLPPTALAELKQWLGITTAQDDAPLRALLAAGAAMCEAFTGIMPLEQTAEEALRPCTAWQRLATRPVHAIIGIEAVAASGARSPLAITEYAVELEADGTASVRLLRSSSAPRIAVRFIAGLAADWDSLPEPLRHGIIRLAAHQHRERETSGSAPQPPAAVVALWQPWRRMRLL